MPAGMGEEMLVFRKIFCTYEMNDSLSALQ